jgi:hypothetical protein
MKRSAACRLLILAVICGAFLALPWGNAAAAGLQAPVCPHCQMPGQSPGASPCCQHHGKPCQSGPCGQGSSFSCQCPTGAAVWVAPTAMAFPSWQVSCHVPVQFTAPTKVFPGTIFHPPQVQHQPLQV